jgi:hypothetical protein
MVRILRRIAYLRGVWKILVKNGKPGTGVGATLTVSKDKCIPFAPI